MPGILSTSVAYAGSCWQIFFCPLLFFLLSGAVNARQPLEIAKDCKSEYVIVIPKKATPVVQYAAQELQHFVAEISGVRLTITPEGELLNRPAFLLGLTEKSIRYLETAELKRLNNDGLLIKTIGNDVVLTGDGGRGQLYSVYELLERYWGVRFLARDCTVVPKQQRLTLPEINYHYSPPFPYRETSYFDSHPKQIAARQRLNGNAQQCDHTVGGKFQFYPWVHSFYAVVSNEKYFDEHPEFFSLVDGKRNRYSQLCLTNRDMHRVAIARVLGWLKEKPQVAVVDVSQREGGRFCECAPCQELVDQEGEYAPILHFVNKVADAVAEKHPDKWISTLGYNYMPPKTLRPRSNVILRLTHAGCYIHGATSCSLRGGGAQLFLDSFAAWRKITRNLYIWHYTTNFAHYLAPRRNLNGLPQDLRYYAQHGVDFGVFVQGNSQSRGGELAELRQYLAAKLLWDPTLDANKIREDFCRGYYGPAAESVMEVLRLMDRATGNKDTHLWASPAPRETVSPSYLEEMLKVLGRAQDEAKEQPYLDRVEKLLIPYWYVQLFDPDYYHLGVTDIRKIVTQFERVVAANGITHRREQPIGHLSQWISELKQKYGIPVE